MSHTGNRYNRYIGTRRYIGETGFPDARPSVITVQDITKEAILDGHIYEGEFQGNGVTVLTGLSTTQTFDVNNILNDDEKGVIIGYTPSSPYFQLFMNDGTGPKVVYTFPDKFKDDLYHVFKMTINNNGKLLVELDGGDTVFDTRIPSVNDTLYVINYSIY
jgi:hypothetical protein